MSQTVLVRSLYRRTLRIIATVAYADATQIAATRWAEFLPSCLVVSNKDNFAAIARKCFEITTVSPVALSNAFDFLKEASASLFAIEVCALWKEILSSQKTDLVSGLGLMTAAFEVAGVVVASKAPLRARARHFSVLIEQLIHNITTSVIAKRNLKCNFKCTKRVLDQVQKDVLKVANIRRSESRPENFTAFSLVNDAECSEYVLNIILFIVLTNMGFVCFLVGAGMNFRWIRVDQEHTDCNGIKHIRPLFISWSYGAKRRKEVETLFSIADTQWHKPAPWDSKARRSVLYELLRQQLSCRTCQEPIIEEAKRSICKEQLIFLLS